MSNPLIDFLSRPENKTQLNNNWLRHGQGIQALSRIFDNLPSFYPKLQPLLDNVSWYVKNNKLVDLADMLYGAAIEDLFDHEFNLYPELISLLDILNIDARQQFNPVVVKINFLGAYLVGICDLFSGKIAEISSDQLNEQGLPLIISFTQELAPKIRHHFRNGFTSEKLLKFIDKCQNKPAVIAFKQQQRDVVDKACEEHQQQRDIVDKACEEYQQHLLQEIEKHYPRSGNTLHYAVTPQETNFPYNINFIEKNSKEVASPAVKMAIKKYNLVASMRAELHKDEVAVTDQLNNFSDKLNTPENIRVLNQRRDSATEKFFKAVGFLISMVIYKVQTGTFAFWKPQGRLFAEHVNHEILPHTVSVPRAT